MRYRRAASLSLCLVLTGCTRIASTYEPGSSREAMEIPNTHSLGAYVQMNAPEWNLYCVRDVDSALYSYTWRWARQRPMMIFGLKSTAAVRFMADFAIPQYTLERTGPVTLTIAINGHPLDTLHYDTAGQKRFEKPVPAEWLKLAEENQVAIEIDKVVTEGDGSIRGFILTRAGFLSPNRI